MPIFTSNELPATAVCTGCRVEQSINEFPRDWNSKKGYKPRCRSCYAAWMRQYRKRPEAKPRIAATTRKCWLKRKDTTHTKEVQKRNYKRWHERSPRLNIHMALRHAVRRRPTENPATTDQVMDLWRRQDNKCAVSGVEMTWGKGKLMPTSVSLDRIDGSRGYSIDNIRLVCYQVNTFRGRWSDAQMLDMARAIIAHAETAPLPFTFVA